MIRFDSWDPCEMCLDLAKGRGKLAMSQSGQTLCVNALSSLLLSEPQCVSILLRLGTVLAPECPG